MFDRLGCLAEAVADGREAVQATERGEFDAVLMDLQISVMDGLSATALIRKGEARTGKHAPNIALTGQAMRSDRGRRLASGMDGYLEKPVRPKAHFESLSSWARRPGAVTQEGPRWPGLLSEICDDDPESERAIMEIGRAEIAWLLADLRSSLDRSDLPSAGWLSHTLRGAAAMIGARRPAGLCMRIEAVGLGDDLSRAQDEFATMRLESDRLGADLGRRLSPR